MDEYRNIYLKMRKQRNLTREKADEVLVGITAEKLERIENEKAIPTPDDINIMADCYKEPQLRNYYCANVCPVGIAMGVKNLEDKPISQITLELLSLINTINKDKEKLVDIMVDGEIADDEIESFINIQNELEELSQTVESLKLWAQRKVIYGEINQEKYEALKDKRA